MLEENNLPEKGTRWVVGEQPAGGSFCKSLLCCFAVLLAAACGLWAGMWCAVKFLPSVEIRDLQLLDLTTPKIGESASDVKLHFQGTTAIENPSYGVTARPIDFSIFYKDQTLGSKSFQGLKVPGPGNATIPEEVLVDSLPSAL